MDYQQTIEFLYQQLAAFHRTGADAYHANLDITIQLMDVFHYPYTDFESIHVAGTNGKGSVSHMLASILQTAGYKTGLYTSPHMKDFRERIRINGKMIPKSYVTGFVKSNMDVFEKLKPSFFEMTTAMAFCYFSEQQVDIAVIETGLGGRLDSTNVIQPEISVITNIGKDHTGLLGKTLDRIAFEKAGIIKNETPVVLGKILPGLRSVFDIKAASLKAPVYYSQEHYRIKKSWYIGAYNDRLIMDITSTRKRFHLESPLTGFYQKENMITVLQTCELLEKKGYSVHDHFIIKGIAEVIKNTGLMGRWQILGHKPLIICDSGHNVDGIKQVVRQLKTIQYNTLHIVFGMVNDKEAHSILKLLIPDAAYYFCRPSVPRGLDENILAGAAAQYGIFGKVFPSVKDALIEAKKQSTQGDVIFIGGSSFVVAEVI